VVKEALAGIYQTEILLPRNPLRAINAYLVRGRGRCLLIDTGMNAHCERLLGSLRRECLDFPDSTDGEPPAAPPKSVEGPLLEATLPMWRVSINHADLGIIDDMPSSGSCRVGAPLPP
jgi:hypothetical protein